MSWRPCAPTVLTAPSLGLAETLDELTRNQGILYDAAVVETCLQLYGQDLPDSGQVSVGATPLAVMMSLPSGPR